MRDTYKTPNPPREQPFVPFFKQTKRFVVLFVNCFVLFQKNKDALYKRKQGQQRLVVDDDFFVMMMMMMMMLTSNEWCYNTRDENPHTHWEEGKRTNRARDTQSAPNFVKTTQIKCENDIEI